MSLGCHSQSVFENIAILPAYSCIWSVVTGRVSIFSPFFRASSAPTERFRLSLLRPKCYRWCWLLLSFRGLLLRIAAEVAGRLGLGGEGPCVSICADGGDFMRAAWPPGAISPALLHSN